MDRLVGSRRRPNRPGRPSGSHPPRASRGLPGW
jgi:hypothetical protein